MIVARQLKPSLAIAALMFVLSLPCFAEIAPQDVGPIAPERSAAVPQELSLDQAVAVALGYNPQVTVAEQGVWVNRGLLLQALSGYMPRFDITSARTTPVNLPPFTFERPGATYTTTFTLSQQLYTSGSVKNQVKAARNTLQGSEQAFQRSRQEIAFRVRGAYYAVLTAEEGVKVQQDVVSSAQEHLRVAQLRYDAGVAPKYDVLAADARVARVQQQLISAQADLDTAWAGLATVMGVTLPGGTKLSTPLPEEIKEVSLSDLTTQAIDQRPDLKTAIAGVAAAKAEVDVVRAARLPTISGSITYSLQPKTAISGSELGLPASTELVVSQNSGAIAVSATWNLFNGGFIYGSIRSAQARQRQAEQAVEQLRLQIGLDVKTAYFAFQSAQGQMLAAHKEVEQAQEAHRVATLRYEEGVGTSVEILDAEATLQDARTRLNQSVFGLNLSLAQIDFAAGRDYFAPVPSSPTAGVPKVPGL